MSPGPLQQWPSQQGEVEAARMSADERADTQNVVPAHKTWSLHAVEHRSSLKRTLFTTLVPQVKKEAPVPARARALTA